MADLPRIRVLVADDEPLARSLLQKWLAEAPGFEVVGIGASGRAAVDLVRQCAPDLMLLDIHMPGLDGFEVIEKIGRDEMPHVIFVTAYQEYAARAFEVHALDYLLKPLSRPRFREALQRAAERIRSDGGSGDRRRELLTVLEQLRTPGHLKRLAFRKGERAILIPTSDVEWIEAAGKTVRVHAGGKVHELRESMKEMEGKLDPDVFLRVHRSAIVNLEHVAEIHTWFKGTFRLTLSSGATVRTGSAFRDRVDAILRNRP